MFVILSWVARGSNPELFGLKEQPSFYQRKVLRFPIVQAIYKAHGWPSVQKSKILFNSYTPGNSILRYFFL